MRSVAPHETSANQNTSFQDISDAFLPGTMKADFLQEEMKKEFEKIISGDIELDDIQGLGITLNRERFGIALNYPFVISDIGSVFINW